MEVSGKERRKEIMEKGKGGKNQAGTHEEAKEERLTKRDKSTRVKVKE